MHVAPRRLGSWGFEVGGIALGCMSMTGVYDVKQRNDDRSVAAIQRALDLGMTLVDTADSYGPATNELLVGRATASRPEAILSTKVGLVGRSDGALLRNGRPEHITSAATESLRRLGADRIDLYSLHTIDPDVPLSETWGAMADLVTAGTVRSLGVVTDDIRVVSFLQQRFPVTAVFAEFSLWNQRSRRLVDWCGARAISVLATSPLGRGVLTGTIPSSRRFDWTDLRSKLPEFTTESMAQAGHQVTAAKAVARRHRATASQVSLAWVLAQGDHIIPVAGTRQPEHVEENARAGELSLSDLDLRQLAGEDVSAELL